MAASPAAQTRWSIYSTALRQIGAAVVGTPDARIVPEPSAVDGVHRVEEPRHGHDMRREVGRRLRVAGWGNVRRSLVEVRAALDDPGGS